MKNALADANKVLALEPENSVAKKILQQVTERQFMHEANPFFSGTHSKVVAQKRYMNFI
jgi:hypothetical protein